MAGLFPDALGGGLQIKERAATARTGDELGLGNARTGALQHVVGKFGGAYRVGLSFNAHQITQAVAEETARENAGFKQPAEKTGVITRGSGGGVANPERCPETKAEQVFGQLAIGAERVEATGDGRTKGGEGENQAVVAERPESVGGRRKIGYRHVNREEMAMAAREFRHVSQLPARGGSEAPTQHQAAATGGNETGQVGGRKGLCQIEHEKIDREFHLVQDLAKPGEGRSVGHRHHQAFHGCILERGSTEFQGGLGEMIQFWNPHDDARRLLRADTATIRKRQDMSFASYEMKGIDGVCGDRRADGRDGRTIRFPVSRFRL